jgi:predicted permease
MKDFRAIRRSVPPRLTHPTPDAEIDAELRAHLESLADELRAQGMEPDAAWREAVRRFGDVNELRAQVQRIDAPGTWKARWSELWGSTVQDVRYGLRQLRRNPGFAAVAVLTLALGIGATTAMFSLADATLLRRPAVSDPGSLVAVYTSSTRGARTQSSYRDYLDYRDRSETLADLAATTTAAQGLGDDEYGTRFIRNEFVTGNYFGLLGVQVAVGRAIQPADAMPGEGAGVAVLSSDLWRDHFGADPDIVGTTIRLNGTAFEVIGVAPEGFRGLTLANAPDLWTPLPPQTGQSFNTRWLGRLVGRLEAGSTVEKARAELLAISARLAEENPAERDGAPATVDPLGHYVLPNDAEQSLPQFVWMLVGVVATTLLLACANLANLLLARSSTRAAEMGVRLAIGGGRGRLVGQLLTESLLLSALGATAGLLLASLLMRALQSFQIPGRVSIADLDASLNVRVLAVAAGLALLTTVLFGLAPALQATRKDVIGSLRSGRSGEGRRGGGALRLGLVSTQVALCVVLLVGSGLFLRSLRSALGADLGFRTESLALYGRFNLRILGYSPAATLEFVEELRARALQDSRVSSAAIASRVPLQTGGPVIRTFTEVDGYQPAPDEDMRIDMVFTSPEFLETLEIPLLEGRDFVATDRIGSTPVAIVSRSMADLYWPGGKAVGGTLHLGPDGLVPRPSGPITVEVVGIAEDLQWYAIDDEPTNYVFFPHAQFPELTNGFLTLAVRTTGNEDELEVLSDLRAQVRSMAPDLTPQYVRTMDDMVGDVLMPQRLGATLLSGFGALALLLASIGIAGVVSYTVREQRRSIGVRIALGARATQVLGMVVRGMSRPIMLGLGVGIVVARLLDRSIEPFLYDVTPGDVLTYVTIAAGLGAVALIATLVPAREAAKLDPLRVIKSE